MTALAELVKERAVAAFIDTRCACGQQKKAAMPFCRACAFALPDPLRRALWHPGGRGFAVEGYEPARAALVEMGRIVSRQDAKSREDRQGKPGSHSASSRDLAALREKGFTNHESRITNHEVSSAA